MRSILIPVTCIDFMKIACGIVDVSYHNMLDIAGSQETF